MKKRIFACILVLLMLGLVLYVGLKQKYGSVDVMSGSIAQQQDRPKIALTFDDGPHPYYTEQLLKGLAKRKVKATFFVTGENVEAYPEVTKQICEEGHLIGNHTYSHSLRQIVDSYSKSKHGCLG